MNLYATIDLTMAALYRDVRITGFTKPDEELIRAAVSRVPPDLLGQGLSIVADPTMGAKHGRYRPSENTIWMNPKQFRLRQRFGHGQGWIWHFELTMVHEIGHAVWQQLTPVQQSVWYGLSGWVKGQQPGNLAPYVERRPGWEIGKTEEWTHKPNVQFTRRYAERNPFEDFADSFAFWLLGKPHQMSPAKRAYMDRTIKPMIKSYPTTTIEGPTKAYGERGN